MIFIMNQTVVTMFMVTGCIESYCLYNHHTSPSKLEARELHKKSSSSTGIIELPCGFHPFGSTKAGSRWRNVRHSGSFSKTALSMILSVCCFVFLNDDARSEVAN